MMAYACIKVPHVDRFKSNVVGGVKRNKKKKKKRQVQTPAQTRRPTTKRHRRRLDVFDNTFPTLPHALAPHRSSFLFLKTMQQVENSQNGRREGGREGRWEVLLLHDYKTSRRARASIVIVNRRQSGIKG